MSDIWVVFWVVLIIWLGLAGLMFKFHRDTQRLKEKMDQVEKNLNKGTST